MNKMMHARSTERGLLARAATTAVVALCGLGAAGAQQAAAEVQDDRVTVWDGVYTAGQAARGKAVYDSHCAACHGSDLSGSSEARPLAGERFMQDWREDNVNSLFTRIRRLMPFDEPATLSDAAYLDSVAYILEFNGFPPGSRELRADGLADIRIEGRDGPGPVPSFALVQVAGCLSRGSDGDWVLTRSTAAARTRDPSGSGPDELQALAGQPLGERTFTLMSAYPDPSEHAGHRMEAKGFLIRNPDGDRINLSSLAMIAPDPGCEP